MCVYACGIYIHVTHKHTHTLALKHTHTYTQTHAHTHTYIYDNTYTHRYSALRSSRACLRARLASHAHAQA